MTLSFRRAALTSFCALFVAALAPVACSSKAPETEPVIGGGCTTDLDCPAGNHCAAASCIPNCMTANDCPAGQTCSSGRCSSPSGTGGTSSSETGVGGGTAGVIHIEAGPDSTEDGLAPDAACGTGSAEATLVPVSMFVMFDRSGSMLNNAMPTRWDNAALALTTFFQDPGAADLAIALRFFPHDLPAVGCTNNNMTGCIAADCAQPLVPPMADPLTLLPKLTADPAPTDAHEAALIAAVGASPPTPPNMGGGNMGGGTPTSVALQGAVDWAVAYQTAHPRPEQQTVVVFVTDGEPNGCEEDVDTIAQIAADAYTNSNIATYVVGLTDNAGDLAFLNDLAVAGGTGQAFIVTDGATAAMDLVTTLKEIQGDSLTCNFPFPMTVDGGMPDPTRINVDYTPGAAGSAPVEFFRVDNAAACPMDQPGWYYNDNANPTEIILCPVACTTVTADSAAKIGIQIGCTSRPPPET